MIIQNGAYSCRSASIMFSFVSSVERCPNHIHRKFSIPRIFALRCISATNSSVKISVKGIALGSFFKGAKNR